MTTKTDLLTEMLLCSIIIERQIKAIDNDKSKSVANRKKIQDKIKQYAK